MTDFRTKAEEVIAELKDSLTKLGWSDPRPWDEFLKDFAAPKNLEERVWTNFLYFRGNYIVVLCTFVVFALCLNPKSLLAVMFAVSCILILLVLKIESSPDHEISKEYKLAASLPVAILILFTSGALFWALYGVLLGMLASIVHMVFRTRTIKSRINTVYEENKLSR
mmetsp:Transcript_15496/g.27807  ORF Transcript_15496/g.27807 Transcript_15496/m.27807 type:complete len:167 (+) Transcript_15496:64-564(+)